MLCQAMNTFISLIMVINFTMYICQIINTFNIHNSYLSIIPQLKLKKIFKTKNKIIFKKL